MEADTVSVILRCWETCPLIKHTRGDVPWNRFWVTSDAVEPGKGQKQEIKVHMDQKEEKGEKKSSLPALVAPRYYFAFILPSIYKSFEFKALNFAIVPCER